MAYFRCPSLVFAVSTRVGMHSPFIDPSSTQDTKYSTLPVELDIRLRLVITSQARLGAHS